MYSAITDVSEVKVGHYTDKKAATRCTVILCEAGAVAEAVVRAIRNAETLAGMPATRDVIRC